MPTSLKQPILLLGLCFCLVLPGLLTVPMTRHQELRVALAARHMAQGESWLVPQFRGEVRLQKPPLMYWMVAPFYALTKVYTHPAIPRIPSFFSGILLLLVIFYGGRLLIGRKRAARAAVVTASCFLFMRHAALSETDILFTLCITLSLLSFYAALLGKKVGPWLLAGLGAGAGFMTKGPAAVLIPLLTAGFFLATDRRARTRFSWPGFVMALLLCVVVAIPWYLMLLGAAPTQEGTQAVTLKELGKLVIQSEHPGPIFYYLYTFPISMLPWGLLLPVALWRFWPLARLHRGTQFLAIWWIVTFCLLSGSASKQAHYGVLLLPPTALLLGWFLVHAQRMQVRVIRCWMRVFYGACGVGAIVAGLAVAGFSLHDETYSWMLLLPAVFVVGVGIFVFRNRDRVWGKPLWGLLMMLVVVATTYAITNSHYGKDGVLPQFAVKARPLLSDEGRLFGVGRHLSSLEFYLGRRLREEGTAVASWKVASSGDAVVIMERKGRSVATEGLPDAAEVDVQWLDGRGRLFLKP